MKVVLTIGAVAVGFLLIVVGSIWSSVFAGTSSWTDEKSNRISEIDRRLVVLGGVVNATSTSMHGGMDPAQAKTEFDQLKIEKEQLSAEFESSAKRPKTVAKVLRWSGIGLAVLGLLGYYAVKQTS